MVWAEEEPREDRPGLRVSLALIEAMQTPLQDWDGGGFVPAGVKEYSTVEARHDDGHPSVRDSRVWRGDTPTELDAPPHGSCG